MPVRLYKFLLETFGQNKLEMKKLLIGLLFVSTVASAQLRKDQLNAINARDIKSSGAYSNYKTGKLIDSLILSLGSQLRASGYISVGNVSGIATDVPLSGDGTLSNTGALSVIKIKGNTIPVNASGALTNNGSGVLSWTPITSTLAGATDVNISSPSNNQFLQFQTSDSKWHNHTLAVGDLSGLLDSRYFQITNNLSEGTAATIRTNLGLDARYFQISNNLSEGTAATMRTNLGFPANSAGVLTNNGSGVLTWGSAGTTYTADESTLHLSGTQFSIKSSYVAPAANGGTGISSLGTGVATALGINNGATGSFLTTANVNTNERVLPELGQRINDNFNRGSLGGNWTLVGSSTFTIVSNQLQISGGTNVNTDYIYYSAYASSNLSSWTVDMDIIPGTINSTSYGVSITVPGGVSASNIYVQVSLDATNLGRLSISTNQAGDVINSQGRLGITTGDNLHMKMKLIKGGRIIATLTNTTTKYSIVVEYQAHRNLGYSTGAGYTGLHRFGIGSFGGTHVVDNFTVTANTPVGVDFGFVGNSISFGFNSNDIIDTWPEIIGEKTGALIDVHACAGCGSSSMNTSEVLAMGAKTLIIEIGSNDINGLGAAGAFTALNTFVGGLTGYTAGTNMFFMLALPRNNAAFATFNGLLVSNFPNAIIDCYTEALTVGGNAFYVNYTDDGTHPNAQYHYMMAEQVINTLNLPLKNKKETWQRLVRYQSNSKVAITDLAFANYQAQAALHVIATDPSNQLLVGQDNSQKWLHISGGGAGGSIDQFNIGKGAMYNSSGQWIAGNTVGYGFRGGANTSGYASFYTNSSLTIGNTFVPFDPIGFTPTGLWVGTIEFPYTNSTSTLQVVGSFSTVYLAKATSYTLTASDQFVEVTATGQTITLPTAVGISGREYTIKLTASGTCTVATTSSQNIDASTTYSLSAQYKYVTVKSNNVGWLIMANN